MRWRRAVPTPGQPSLQLNRPCHNTVWPWLQLVHSVWGGPCLASCCVLWKALPKPSSYSHLCGSASWLKLLLLGFCFLSTDIRCTLIKSLCKCARLTAQWCTSNCKHVCPCGSVLTGRLLFLGVVHFPALRACSTLLQSSLKSS